MNAGCPPRLADHTFGGRRTPRHFLYCLLFAAYGSLAGLVGCATPQFARIGTALGEREECLEVFRRVDEAVEQAQVADGLAARVAGFPYLRVNRFLASYAGEAMSAEQFAQWQNRMVALGTEGYAVEIANLPPDKAEELAHRLWSIDARYAWLGPAIAECTARLARCGGRGSPLRTARCGTRTGRIRDMARIVGLYWLTRIPFAAGIRRWHEETRQVFEQPIENLPIKGRLQAYLPPSGALRGAQVAGILERASANALGIPDPGRDDLDALFRTFAPEFVVDTAGEADEPGELGWGRGDTPQVVSKLPVVYRRVSHTRYAGRALLQLSYAIWFPARPKGVGWDILAGQLDGVLWRVTLAPDGVPWVYDSIHLCGCYHLFFPTARASMRPQPDTLDETAFLPQTLPRVEPATRITLRHASGTHYLERVMPAPPPAASGIEYLFADDDTLRSLPHRNGGRRSAFRPDGIVPGTERGERYLFWPMGVPEPGAMRQWGRHATAFVGRRHFDDPDLLERYFTLREH